MKKNIIYILYFLTYPLAANAGFFTSTFEDKLSPIVEETMKGCSSYTSKHPYDSLHCLKKVENIKGYPEFNKKLIKWVNKSSREYEFNYLHGLVDKNQRIVYIKNSSSYLGDTIWVMLYDKNMNTSEIMRVPKGIIASRILHLFRLYYHQEGTNKRKKEENDFWEFRNK